jgi:hypothetical protein
VSRIELSRRNFLIGSAGLAASFSLAEQFAHAQQTPPSTLLRSNYERGTWLYGDPHVHTYYSKNGQYSIAQQAEQAVRHGLQWIVVADHGSMTHSKTVAKEALAELQSVRRQYPKLTIFQGVTWNMPMGEQSVVIMPPGADEGKLLAEFLTQYDSVCRTAEGKENTEEVAIDAVKSLLNMNPLPLVIVTQPSRRGVLSPSRWRLLTETGPDVFRGFEGSPGHQAASLNGKARGGYAGEKRQNSWDGYPLEAYRTYGGYDWMAAKVGGLWDALLAQGVPLFMSATANSHRHWQDLSQIDDSSFETDGRTKLSNKRATKSENEDFHPGEYSRTAVFVPTNDPPAILQALRSGNSFTSLGNLIERCEILAISGNQVLSMGSTLVLPSADSPVTISIRIKQGKKRNANGDQPKLDHIDIIAGNIEEKAYRKDSFNNPSTGVVSTLTPAQATKKGDYLDYAFRIDKVQGNVYLRVRGTNRANVQNPAEDSSSVKPWEDLWFYSNPIFVRVPRKA